MTSDPWIPFNNLDNTNTSLSTSRQILALQSASLHQQLTSISRSWRDTITWRHSVKFPGRPATPETWRLCYHLTGSEQRWLAETLSTYIKSLLSVEAEVRDVRVTVKCWAGSSQQPSCCRSCYVTSSLYLQATVCNTHMRSLFSICMLNELIQFMCAGQTVLKWDVMRIIANRQTRIDGMLYLDFNY